MDGTTIVSKALDRFIEKEGNGNIRDVLNVALARLLHKSLRLKELQKRTKNLLNADETVANKTTQVK